MEVTCILKKGIRIFYVDDDQDDLDYWSLAINDIKSMGANFYLSKSGDYSIWKSIEYILNID